MKPSRVKVGDTVCLNEYGLNLVFGSSLGLSHMRSLRMKVIEVDNISDGIYDVQVDDSEINMYMLMDLCFDVVQK